MTKISEPASLQNPPGVVRLVVPIKVASNLQSLQSALAKFATKLGCGSCFSGRPELPGSIVIDPDPVYRQALKHVLDRTYIADEALNISEASEKVRV